MRQSSEVMTGAILAGGQSVRMGHDKALLPIGGRPMIEIVATTMREIFDRLCIVADDAEAYQFLGLPVIPDLTKRSGPLGGIHAALSHCPPASVFVVGCDTPKVSAALIRHVIACHSAARATVARHRDGIHPLCGIYTQRALPAIEESLSSGFLKVSDVLQVLEASYVEITPDLPFYRADLLENVNDSAGYGMLAASFI